MYNKYDTIFNTTNKTAKYWCLFFIQYIQQLSVLFQSSLLYAILGELPLSSGTLKVSGTISYAAQEPWLFEGSVRQNILFGSPYDKIRYSRVIWACALSTDLEQLPYGDCTLVGDRGIILSGGQRARINLAR